jgi:hypothetical protein
VLARLLRQNRSRPNEWGRRRGITSTTPRRPLGVPDDAADTAQRDGTGRVPTEPPMINALRVAISAPPSWRLTKCARISRRFLPRNASLRSSQRAASQERRRRARPRRGWRRDQARAMHNNRSAMSQLGQSRRFGDVRTTSAFPLIADVRCEDGRSEKCQLLTHAPQQQGVLLITSSARASTVHSGNPAFRRPSVTSCAFDCPLQAIHPDKAGLTSSRRAAASRASASRPRWAKADARQR